jgi:hypothetical protein
MCTRTLPVGELHALMTLLFDDDRGLATAVMMMMSTADWRRR